MKLKAFIFLAVISMSTQVSSSPQAKYFPAKSPKLISKEMETLVNEGRLRDAFKYHVYEGVRLKSQEEAKANTRKGLFASLISIGSGIGAHFLTKKMKGHKNYQDFIRQRKSLKKAKNSQERKELLKQLSPAQLAGIKEIRHMRVGRILTIIISALAGVMAFDYLGSYIVTNNPPNLNKQ